MLNGNAGRDHYTGNQFDGLYSVYRTRIYRTIRGIILDPAAAEDLTQETFERGFRWLLTHECKDTPAWLHRVAVNLSISYLRRQRLMRMLPMRLGQGSAPSGFERVEARTLATRALEVLTPRQRAVVVLHFYGDMTRDEIASTLGIPPGTVGSRMAAALTAMRGVFESERQPTQKGAEDAG